MEGERERAQSGTWELLEVLFKALEETFQRELAREMGRERDGSRRKEGRSTPSARFLLEHLQTFRVQDPRQSWSRMVAVNTSNL